MGYSPWIHKQRTSKEGGWVAIVVKAEIAPKTTKVENIEDHDQEITWIEYKPTNNKIYIGTYYGKKEKGPREVIEREQLQTKKPVRENRINNPHRGLQRKIEDNRQQHHPVTKPVRNPPTKPTER